MRSRLKQLVGVGAALAFSASPSMAAAATTAAIQPINPLIAVSVYGTQASAQTVCANATGAAAAAGAEVAAQGSAGCVLPAIDTPPPVAQPLPPPAAGFGIAPVILGLVGIAALAALILSSNGDSDSPASPS